MAAFQSLLFTKKATGLPVDYSFLTTELDQYKFSNLKVQRTGWGIDAISALEEFLGLYVETQI